MTNIYARFDQAELDREYSPSSCVDDINVFLEMYARQSETAKATALDNGTCIPDRRFGTGAEETLDLFVPEHAESAPLHVFIHGGYWQLLSKDDSCFAAPMFQEAGSCFAALNYTLAPQQSLTGIVAEIRRAIVWLYSTAENWGYDRNRIFLSGSSAGAHLAAMMLVTEWADYGLPEDTVKGICAISGIFDLEPLVLTYVNDVVGMDTEEGLQNSPAHQRIRNRCPVILAYGDNETDEFKRQTTEFGSILRRADIPVTVNEIIDRNHFDIVLDLTDQKSWLTQQVLHQMGLA